MSEHRREEANPQGFASIYCGSMEAQLAYVIARNEAIQAICGLFGLFGFNGLGCRVAEFH